MGWKVTIALFFEAVAIGGVIFGFLLAKASLIILGLFGAITAMTLGHFIQASQNRE